MWPFRKKAKIRPVGGWILVRRLEAKTVTDGGIHLPDRARQKESSGDVVAVGRGRPLGDGEWAPFTVRKHDRVLFSPFDATEFSMDGRDYLLVKEEHVLAVID